jgi:hypothetical protein
MSEDRERPTPPRRRSASAEAAALRWSETHPDEDPDLPEAPSGGPSEPPPRRSASAEAAALRWSEEHEDET